MEPISVGIVFLVYKRPPALIKDTKSILENFALTVTFDFEIVHDHCNPLFKIHSMGLVQVR